MKFLRLLIKVFLIPVAIIEVITLAIQFIDIFNTIRLFSLLLNLR